MNSEQRAKEIEAKTELVRKTGFDRFMNQPATRMMLSMIPASEERKDALQILIQEAFNSGFAAGQGEMAITFLGAMFDRKSGQ